MPASPAAAIDLTDDERDALTDLARASSVRTSLAQRANIVLLAGEGTSNTEIAELVGVSRPTVILWRKRFRDQGIAGLYDERRQGRPRHVSHEMIIAATLKPPPQSLGLTHWSSRSLARRLGVGNSTVARCWREYGVQPLGRDTYQFSTVPEMMANVTDVLGLFLAPSRNAIMLSLSDNDEIQGWDPADHPAAMRAALLERADCERIPQGLAPGFTALESVNWTIVGAADQAAAGRGFQRFVEYFANARPGQDLHLVMDRRADDEHAEVLECFDADLRSHVHFTNSLASWSRLVAVWFGIIERQTPGSDHSSFPTDIITRIRAFLKEWDEHVDSGTWIKAPS
ncbi:MAG: IS630 family transposase [Actinobacteria bacterium]|uniref:Unannotated protein n=1 Tax=freshwater metagenome TaxID=449393 RepID=A0A6J7L8I8_9ZZZZ|nr:IS630 family transposase [Actinomycetota bacterium]